MGELQDVPTLDDFADNSIDTYTWPNASGTTLQFAYLNGSLQMGMNVDFKTTE